MPPRPIEILLVEDNPADIAFTRNALQSARVLNHLHVAEDGQTAIDFLHRRGAFAKAPRPDLILLDLNLPGRDGREVLADIKSDSDLTIIPVIVLTTSGLQADVENAYRNYANAYITKPVDSKAFLSAITSLKRFWIDLVRLPGVHRE
jgi:CheY-like chemotaxis protein